MENTARQLVIARRMVVVVGLVFLPGICTWLWNLCLNRKSTQFFQDYGTLIAYFTWGMSATYPCLGVWLVARHQLFNSISGGLRAAAYLLAFFYGWLFKVTLQDWLHSDLPSMPIPGTSLQHYGLAAILSVEVAVSAWVFWPMVFVLRRRLTDAQLTRECTPRPDIRFLLLWTALAALILTSVRLLATYGKPLNLAMQNQSVFEALIEQIARLPLQIVLMTAIAIVMIGMEGGIRGTLVAMTGAVVVWFGGTQVLFWGNAHFQNPQLIYGVMTGPLEKRLPYLAGILFTATIVFAFARIMGLAFRKAPTDEQIEQAA